MTLHSAQAGLAGVRENSNGHAVVLSLATTAQLFEMLRTLLSAGVPLTQALDGLRRQPELSASLERVLRAVESGHSLSRSFLLAGFSDPMVVSLLRLGERTGTMDKVVAELAAIFRWRCRLHSELKSRLTYPAILALACTLLVGLGPPFLLRPILDFLQQSGAVLPAASRLLMALIGALCSPGFWLVAVALSGLSVAGISRALRRAPLVSERWLLSRPVLGPCLSQLLTARFGRALLSGLASGYPLLGALELAAGCSGSATVEEECRQACQALRQGETPEGAFLHFATLDPLLTRGVPLGLSLGAVETLLSAVLRLTEEKLRHRIDDLLALLEPTLLAFMGGLVALCILATVAPMMSLLQAVS